MSHDPVVSVVIPTYNDERFIGDALSSVFSQTYPHIEILVVDDGSSDKSIEIAAAFGERVKILRQKNAGSAVARNFGMREATGDLISFLDADDYWLPTKLERQVECFRADPNCSFVYCAWREWYWPSIADPMSLAPAPSHIEQIPQIDALGSGWLYSPLLLDCTIQTSTVVLKRSLMQEIGFFDESLRRGQDYDYWLRCARHVPIQKLATELALYRLREDSITKRVHPVNYGGVILERAVRKWGIQDRRGRSVSASSVRRRLSKVWRDFAFDHASKGNRSIAVRAVFKALRWWPFDYRSWLCLVRCALPIATAKRAAVI